MRIFSGLTAKPVKTANPQTPVSHQATATDTVLFANANRKRPRPADEPMPLDCPPPKKPKIN